MTLDIIIYVNNLEKTIESLYNKIEDELKDIKYNIIFVDNSSTDKTLDLLKNIQQKNDLCIKIISLSKKFDKDTCIYTGLLHTKHQLVCIYNLEDNTQLSQISKMYDYITKHKEYDQVCLQTNYDEKSFIKKTKLKLFNKLYGLKYDSSIMYSRIMKRNVVNAIIEYTKIKPFSLYTFHEIGFNTYYMKTDINKLEDINYQKLLSYSNNKNIIFNTINLILLTITFIYLLLTILEIFTVNNNVLLIFILLTNSLNIFLHTIFNKKKDKTYFLIKEKVGFEEDVL
jgi:hypothetical protein